MDSACISQLPSLEPLLGIALALNLAFLNLPIFHFITIISKSVEKCLEGLQDVTRQQIASTPWYLDAKALSEVHTLQDLDISAKFPLWIRFESITAAAIFNVIFNWRVGKFGAILSSVLASALIILGVYSNTSKSSDATCDLVQWFGTPIVPSMIMFAWPMFCVACGATLRFFTLKKVKYNLRNIGDTAVKEVDKALTDTEKAIGSASTARQEPPQSPFVPLRPAGIPDSVRQQLMDTLNKKPHKTDE